MEINTVIEVKGTGDFDMTYTDCVMVHTDKLNVDEITKEFYQIQGITSNKWLDYRELHNITQDFISFLELKGFSRLETEVMYFCD
jgi:hypothetical protein